MMIPISKNLCIARTAYCWQLSRKQTINGVTGFAPYRYFTALRMALEAACEKEALTEANTLKEAAGAFTRTSRRHEISFGPTFLRAA